VFKFAVILVCGATSWAPDNTPQCLRYRNIPVFTVGLITSHNYDIFENIGTAAIFGPGTNIVESAAELLRLLGHNLPPIGEMAAE